MKRISLLAIGASLIGAITSAYAADTIPPTIPGNLTVTVVSNTQLNLSWDASTDNVGVTAYLLERCKGVGCTNFAQIVSIAATSYNNTGLTISSEYSYRVRARDAANQKSAYSNIVTTTTPPDTQAPTIPTGLAIVVTSNTQLSISWTASTDDVKVTGYSLDRCVGVACSNFALLTSPGATAITYNNTPLIPGTSYSYRIRAKDASGNISDNSATATASTLPDTQAPTVPGNLTGTTISNTQINLAWTASTDDAKVTGYKVERCMGVGCSNFALLTSPTGVTYNNTSLTAGGSYSYRVRATDATGNLSGYSNIVTNATTGTDATKPSTPAGLTATPISGTQINLSWTASTDNQGVTGYRVERCTGATCTTYVQVATPATNAFDDTGRSPTTTYRYRVRANDAANNLSSYSTVVAATTPVLGDIQAPTVPSGVIAAPTSTSQINLSWTASTDNVSVTNYQVERCQGVGCSNFTPLASPIGTTFSNLNLAASTSYSYRVRATDAANNISDYSAIASAVTAAPPPVTFSYTYDLLGRLKHVEGSDGSVIDYTYDANGNVTVISRQ